MPSFDFFLHATIHSVILIIDYSLLIRYAFTMLMPASFTLFFTWHIYATMPPYFADAAMMSSLLMAGEAK